MKPSFVCIHALKIGRICWANGSYCSKTKTPLFDLFGSKIVPNDRKVGQFDWKVFNWALWAPRICPELCKKLSVRAEMCRWSPTSPPFDSAEMQATRIVLLSSELQKRLFVIFSANLRVCRHQIPPQTLFRSTCMCCLSWFDSKSVFLAWTTLDASHVFEPPSNSEHRKPANGGLCTKDFANGRFCTPFQFDTF